VSLSGADGLPAQLAVASVCRFVEVRRDELERRRSEIRVGVDEAQRCCRSEVALGLSGLRQDSGFPAELGEGPLGFGELAGEVVLAN